MFLDFFTHDVFRLSITLSSMNGQVQEHEMSGRHQQHRAEARARHENHLSMSDARSNDQTVRNALHPEASFRDRLLIERKRTERTGRPFLLALIDISRIRSGASSSSAHADGSRKLDGLVAELFSHTRHIDIKGWYYHERVLGVLYPETSPPSQPPLGAKLREILQAVLGDDYPASAGISWYAFPGDTPDDGPPGRNTGLFYDSSVRGVRRLQRLVKRLVDIAGGLFGIALFSPLFVLIPLLIKLTSRGPVLFRQRRIGANGRHFTFLKFRSMYIHSDESMHRTYVTRFIHGQVDTDDEGAPTVFKITTDPRVTPIGRLLRRTSLDELPQFFNVLKGDMSLVGPRPAIPYEIDEYELWHRRRLMGAKPGITGLWQVEGRSATTFDGMVRMDIEYLDQWSVWSDVKLIARTPLAMMLSRGAY